MKIITTNELLLAQVPNVLTTVEGEDSLFEKISGEIEAAEAWATQHLLGDALLTEIAADTTTPVWKDTARLIASIAMGYAIPKLDIVLTPNGYGVVSNTNIAPASKERVERLIATFKDIRDSNINIMLFEICNNKTWIASSPYKWWSATLFPRISVVEKLGIYHDRWENYCKVREQILIIEQRLESDFISTEQMNAFRVLAATGQATIASMRLKRIILDSLISAKPIEWHEMADVIEIMKKDPTTYAQFAASDVAKLFTNPTTFTNDKSKPAYWF